MNQANSHFETPDHPPSSGMSEFDSLSDSDWLDISSGRESDDNDSDSDRDGRASMPLSRRSSMSLGSSREGDIEAWEGFVEDSADEEAPNPEPMYPPADYVGSAGAGPIFDIGRDLAEDQRVRDALDQSLVGTLSGSRSSAHSSTTHSSLRDLRLSFPDPLTSSRDELNRSYEDVSPSETTFSAADDGRVSPLHDEDPGPFISTPEVPHYEVQSYSGHVNTEFDVVLYGFESPAKWSFIQDLMQKAGVASGRILINSTQCTNESTRWLHFRRQISEHASLVDYIAVHDRTQGILTRSEAPFLSNRPSLAIVYLPSLLSKLSEHTLYLPVLVSPGSATETYGTVLAARDAAEQHWNSLAVPTSQVLRLHDGAHSPLVDSRDIGEVEPVQAHRMWQSLVAHAKKRPAKSVTDQIASVHAVTFVALLSLIMGFAFNVVFRTPTPNSTPAASSPTSTNDLGVFGPTVNHSTVSGSTSFSNGAIIPSSLKDFALAVFNPAVTSSMTTQVLSSTRSAPLILKTSDSNDRATQYESVKSLKDVILRPLTTHLSVVYSHTPSPLPSQTAESSKPSDTQTSVSLKFVDSLSEVVDIKMKAVAEVVRHDSKELAEALDELMHTIRDQSKAVVEQSKDKAQLLRERLQYRNDRAREKAKELKERGEQLVSLAGEQLNLRGRTDLAKRKANSLKQSLIAYEAWYRKTHSKWTNKLRDTEADMGRRGKRSGMTTARKERCKGKSSGRLSFGV